MTTELDQKALEAAAKHSYEYEGNRRGVYYIGWDDEPESVKAEWRDSVREPITTYLASLPSDDEVGRVCERLRSPLAISGEHRDEAAALIQSQAAALAVVKRDLYLVRNERDNLSDNVGRLESDLADARKALDALGALAFWFQKYPEFKPNPDILAEVLADLDRARPFIPARRAHKGGADHG